MEAVRKTKILDLVYIALFAAVMAVCSWIAIPATPANPPFTMQTFAVFMACGVLGGKRGTLSVLVYLVLGMLGAPVFAGFAGGIGYMFGMTGGYIIGFIFSALTMWLIEKLFGKKSYILAIAMVLGLIVCYAFGTAWFMYFYAKNTGPIGLWSALMSCVIPFIIPDLLKISLALLICKKLSKLLKIQ